MNNTEFTIITFYQFRKFNDLEKQKKRLKNFCFFHKIKGTILLADEGINGTVAGLITSINLFEKKLKEIGYKKMQIKYSSYLFMPFNRLKIKIKKEIVTFDGSNYNVEKNAAQHINPKEWNKLIAEEDTCVVDVRNNFENEIGTFKGSINPNTKNFSEFKKFANNFLNNFKKRKIAMFCTGGIRCEKASSYLKSKGFKNIFQLNGGILKYLEKVSKNDSKWKGECFVFDNRVTVKNSLVKGTYELCHGCRYPVSFKNRKSLKYIEGISCPKCYNKISAEKKIKLKERNKQIKISKKKGLYNPYIKITTMDY